MRSNLCVAQRRSAHSFPSMERSRALLGSAGGAPSHAADEQPRPLSPKNMRKLNAHIGPKPSEAAQSESSRTRLAWMIAHQTGLRVDEIVNLKATTFADLDIGRRAEMSVVTLTVSKTKGLKAREVFFPVWLVAEMKIYIAGERERSRRKGAPLLGADEPQNLLLNRPDAPAGNSGKRATAATIEADFARAIKDADLMRTEEHLAGTKDATLVEVPISTLAGCSAPSARRHTPIRCHPPTARSSRAIPNPGHSQWPSKRQRPSDVRLRRSLV